MTLVGTVAEVLLLVKVIDCPPVPAGPDRVTVPVDDVPPMTVVGLSVSDVKVAPLMVSVADWDTDPVLAVIVDEVCVVTEIVDTVNVAVDEPAGTVTEAGTVAAVLLLVRATAVPPVPAGPESVTVPVDVEPPTTVVGFKVSDCTTEGSTFRTAVNVLVPRLAEIKAEVTVETADVVIVKVADVDPAGTITFAGGTALALFEARTTVVPPVGAGSPRVTVPVDELLPTTEVGETVNPDKTGGVSVSVAVRDPVPNLAVIVVAVTVETDVVGMENVAEVAPAATVTLAGRVRLEELEDRLTVDPPVGAGPFSETVPVADVPPTMEVGVTVRLDKDAPLIVKAALWVTAPKVPEIVAVVVAPTALVVTVNEADVVPAATVTEAGNVALVLLDDRLTVVPIAGAGPLRITVPIEGAPPTTDVGERVRLVNTGGVTVMVAVRVVVFSLAEIVAAVDAETAVVVMVKEADVAPAPTVTLVGGVALVEFEERATIAPPDAAGPFKVTVPVEEVFPKTEFGAIVMLDRTAGVTVKVAVTDVTPEFAVMVDVVDVDTADVEIVNAVEVEPAATVTLDGGKTLVLLDAKLTTAPPVGAGPLSVTTPVDGLPPITEVGETVTPVSTAGVTTRVPVAEVVPVFPVIVAFVVADTAVVVTVKVAEVAPDATVTVVGGTAAVLLDAKVTTVPPTAAGPLKVTVPVEELPPTTELGDNARLVKVAGVIVRVAVADVVPD